MGMKKSSFSAKAWSVLRMALVWARKGGALKQSRQIKWLQASNRSRGHSDRIRYGERQLSFDDTPAFHFKMHRPTSLRWISCVNPSVDIDDTEERDYFKWSKEDYICQDDNKEEVVTDYDDCGESGSDLVSEEDEEEQEIDSKAEEFIGKFYAQMKFQRQISLLKYNEMLERSIS